MPSIPLLILLVLSGICASVIGSIAGLGGGFITVPLLRLFFHFGPGAAAGASLVFVFANALSASAHFARQRRIAFDIAIPMALWAIPTSIAGAYVSARVPAGLFDVLFAALLCLIAFDLVRKAFSKTPTTAPDATRKASWWFLAAAGLIVGLVSSMFGIGGGIVVIPLLIYATTEELHVVTATSTAIIAMTAPVGIIAQALQHDVVWSASAALAAGGLVGGQVGAVFAQRISARTLGIVLAATMVLAAAAMVVQHLL